MNSVTLIDPQGDTELGDKIVDVVRAEQTVLAAAPI